jgi:peptidoglycan hydrolase CwlO-like protein
MEPFISLLMTSITGFVTFLLGIRKGRAETESVLLLNLEKSINIYQTIIDDMKEEIRSLNEKIDDLEKKVGTLLEENHELKKLMKEHDASTNTKK